MSIESVMPSSHLILCRSLLLLPPIPPSIRVFSSESTLCIRWPNYWSFSFSISPSNEYSGLISFTHTSVSSVQSLSRVRLFATPWIAAHQASLSITNFQSSPKLVHRVGDDIQPSHSLSSPSPPAPNTFQNQSLFQWVNSLHQVAKLLEFQPQHQSF